MSTVHVVSETVKVLRSAQARVKPGEFPVPERHSVPLVHAWSIDATAEHKGGDARRELVAAGQEHCPPEVYIG